MESNHIKCLKKVTSIIVNLSHLLLKLCFLEKIPKLKNLYGNAASVREV